MLTTEAVQASDVVITMGCGDACPVFPGKRYLDWDLDDPAGQGVEAVRPIRDDIERPRPRPAGRARRRTGHRLREDRGRRARAVQPWSRPPVTDDAGHPSTQVGSGSLAPARVPVPPTSSLA